MFFPDDKYSCVLPSLPDQRGDHTMDGLEICGGGLSIPTWTTCIILNSFGQWVISHFLAEERKLHTSWSTEHGVFLMGGYNSGWTTEIIRDGEYDGVPGFDLQYDTR